MYVACIAVKPWFVRHATCPNCRKEVTAEAVDAKRCFFHSLRRADAHYRRTVQCKAFRCWRNTAATTHGSRCNDGELGHTLCHEHPKKHAASPVLCAPEESCVTKPLPLPSVEGPAASRAADAEARASQNRKEIAVANGRRRAAGVPRAEASSATCMGRVGAMDAVRRFFGIRRGTAS